MSKIQIKLDIQVGKSFRHHMHHLYILSIYGLLFYSVRRLFEEGSIGLQYVLGKNCNSIHKMFELIEFSFMNNKSDLSFTINHVLNLLVIINGSYVGQIVSLKLLNFSRYFPLVLDIPKSNYHSASVHKCTHIESVFSSKITKH